MSGPNYAPPLGTATPGPAANVAEAVPAPATFNASAGITSTQEFLQNTAPESAQQGTPAANAVISISGGVAAASLQTFKWE
jgi:hypothetical protein